MLLRVVLEYKHCCGVAPAKAANVSAPSAARHATPDARLAALLAQAAQLRQAGRLAASLEPMWQASRMQPGNAVIQHDLGHTCLLCDRVPEAAAALRAAVACKPDFAHAWWRLGVALELLEDQAASVDAYRQAVALLPSLADAQFRLACLLEGHGHRTDAVRHFRLAAAAEAKSSLGRVAEARALLAEERDSEAEKVLRQCLALDRRDALAEDMLGTLGLADAGRFDEAAGCYERAISLNSGFSGSWYDFARCRTLSDADRPTIARMEQALAQPNLKDTQRVRIYLAIGKAYDDLADHATAIRQDDQATRCVRASCHSTGPGSPLVSARRSLASRRSCSRSYRGTDRRCDPGADRRDAAFGDHSGGADRVVPSGCGRRRRDALLEPPRSDVRGGGRSRHGICVH